MIGLLFKQHQLDLDIVGPHFDFHAIFSSKKNIIQGIHNNDEKNSFRALNRVQEF